MEHNKQSFLPKIMSILFIAMGIFLGMYAFFANATSWTLSGGGTWDNANYLTSGFWNSTPSTGDIITALYGSGDAGSAYTQNWSGYNSGSCLSGGMNVLYTGKLPTTLSDNTIYVLTGPIATGNATINMANCSAVISQNSTGTTFYSTVYLDNGIFIGISTQYNILDNISVNGTGGGIVPVHKANGMGLGFMGTINTTINNIQSYNNQTGGILVGGSYATINNSQAYNTLYGILMFNSSSYNILNNIQTYNNQHGITLQEASHNNFLNNIQSYNNSSVGIHISLSSDNSINNSQTYNNGNAGIALQDSSNNTINNNQSYNNYGYGILLASSINTIINTNQSYNNYGFGIDLDAGSTNTKYYGTNKIFANLVDNVTGTLANLTSGSSPYYLGLGRSTGNLITTGNISWDYLTNPTNGNNYLLSWTGTWTGNAGVRVFTSAQTISYSYGSGILMQSQPVYYSGASLITGGTYDSTKYIGSDLIKTTGDLSGLPTYINTAVLSIVGNSTNGLINNYSIFGDIINYKNGQAINTSTGIILTTGLPINKIITQLSTPYGYFATHFQKEIIVDTILPIFTGTTQTLLTITSGGYYTTGSRITFSDIYLSGATLNGSLYTSGSLITGNNSYIFIVTDLAGNTTGITFTIDTINPTLTGVVNGVYYNSSKTITGSDTNRSGFQLNGTFYAGTSLTVTGEGIWTLTGYDKAGNTTGLSFIIDKTTPLFTGITQAGATVLSGGLYNTGVTINFSDTNISGATLNGVAYITSTLITTNGTHIFIVKDLAGNITGITFTLDTINPILTGIYPTNGLNYTGGNIINFSRTGSDTNRSGYTSIYIHSTGYALNGTSTTYTSTLLNGTYTWYVVATDRAGNVGISTPATFTITTPLTGTVTIVTGTNIQYVGTMPYTSGYVGMFLGPNQACNYIVTGDIVTPLTGSTLGGLYVYPYLTPGDGPKNITIVFWTGSEPTITLTKTIYLDTTTPTPTLTSPISGTTLTGAFSLVWPSVGADAVGLSGYQYFVSTTGTIGTGVIKSGFTTSTSVAITAGEFGTTGTFYRYIKALDKLGNSGASAIRSFNYSGVMDTTPDSFSLNSISNAKIDRVYASNIITITGLSANTPVLASVSKGVLYISGTMVGTTGYIQNGWTVKIELISSSDYDDDVTSILTIGGVTSTFRITTQTEADANDANDYSDISTDLSSTEKLQIIAIFEALRDLYAGAKQDEFFGSLMVMLHSKIDELGTSTANESQREALQYLYDLADQYDGGGTSNTDISNTSWIINGVYTAPNGKRYTITYNSIKKFTSTNFVTPKYYPTLDVLKYDIDRNNPAGSKYINAKTIKARWGRIALDGTRQTSAYTAPNHKVFYFFKTMEGQYSSYTFTVEKYFDSLESVKEYIYNSNR